MKKTGFLLIPLILPLGLEAAGIEYRTAPSGDARVVIVDGADLVHTTQVSATATESDPAAACLDRLDALLRQSGSALANTAKLNVYLREDTAHESVSKAITGRFHPDKRPAISFVTTALPSGDAVVAMDAVAVAGDRGGTAEAGSWAILPAGPRVYISGQAEKADGTVAGATRATLESLGRTLEFLGLGKDDVVQVKSFLTPMSEHAAAEREIAAFFADHRLPPRVFVEWQSSLPIEIEMIVSAPGFKDGPRVEVRTPPGMTTPAIYSRLTIARNPVTVYTDGLYPEDPAAAPEAQLRSLFRRLKENLDLAGSDWMHLVKATYYVSSDALSQEHNRVRPDYFSPRRPPAASKANVTGTGKPGHGITMDFIVVPGEP